MDTCVVVNRVNFELMKQGLLPGMKDIMTAYNGPVVGLIQEDDNIRISTNKGIPIVMKKGTYIENNFKDIVSRIIKSI